MADYSETTFRTTLASFWNPNNTDAMGRLIREWDTGVIPPGVTIERDFKIECNPQYAALGHIKFGQTSVASLVRYREKQTSFDSIINGLRSIRSVTPTIRAIYGVSKKNFSQFGESREEKGIVLMVERIPVESEGTLDTWVVQLSNKAINSHRLLSLAMQVNYLYTLLIQEGFVANPQIVSKLHVIRVQDDATVSCFGKEIKTFGYVPFLINSMELEKADTSEKIDDPKRRDPKVILSYVLDMASIKDAPVAAITDKIRGQLDMYDFSTPGQVYIDIAPELVSTRKNETLSCIAAQCQNANAVYQILTGYESFMKTQAAAHLEFFDRTKGTIPSDIASVVAQTRRYIIWRYYHDDEWTRYRSADIDAYLTQDEKSALASTMDFAPRGDVWILQQKYIGELPSILEANEKVCSSKTKTNSKGECSRPIRTKSEGKLPSDIGSTQVNVQLMFDSLAYDIKMSKADFSSFDVDLGEPTVVRFVDARDGVYIDIDGYQWTYDDLQKQGYDPYTYRTMSGSSLKESSSPDTVLISSDYGMIPVPTDNVVVFDRNDSGVLGSQLNAAIVLSLIATLSAGDL
jgi:hypothetical protein